MLISILAVPSKFTGLLVTALAIENALAVVNRVAVFEGALIEVEEIVAPDEKVRVPELAKVNFVVPAY